jgi:D-glycero-D-manno-heptose 1,7-bisphosphate phosphatase
MNKCVFLDRDGVINKDKVDYVYKIEDLKILDGVKESLKALKDSGYFLIVITNQSGIDKGIYTANDVAFIHHNIQVLTGNLIDAFYFSPYQRLITNSLSAKPGSLMFEKAIAKYNIDIKSSWMVGDRLRDIEPATKLGIKGILLESEYKETQAGFMARNLWDSTQNIILKN